MLFPIKTFYNIYIFIISVNIIIILTHYIIDV